MRALQPVNGFENVIADWNDPDEIHGHSNNFFIYSFSGYWNVYAALRSRQAAISLAFWPGVLP